jgi:hypothetical protein
MNKDKDNIFMLEKKSVNILDTSKLGKITSLIGGMIFYFMIIIYF